MATKRMFSKEIVASDAFVDMPSSTQNLYFHLGMEADDDGFVGNPRKVQRIVGSSDDDMKILIGKRFVLLFESGIVVIKHHRINNNWDKHNCKRTVYLEEFSQLRIKENKAYTLDISQGIPVQTDSSLKTVFRIEENRIENGVSKETHLASLFKPKFNSREDTNTPAKEPSDPRVKKLTKYFRDECKKLYGREPQWTLQTGWKFVKQALTALSEVQVKEMMDMWFEADHEANKGMSITHCLSAYQRDKYLNEV